MFILGRHFTGAHFIEARYYEVDLFNPHSEFGRWAFCVYREPRLLREPMANAIDANP